MELLKQKANGKLLVLQTLITNVDGRARDDEDMEGAGRRCTAPLIERTWISIVKYIVDLKSLSFNGVLSVIYGSQHY